MRCQVFVPMDEPSPNPPWTRCPETATHSVALDVGHGRSLYIRCCEDCWHEVGNVPRPTEGQERE